MMENNNVDNKNIIEIILPSSKSLSNRILMFKGFNPEIQIHNISNSVDTDKMLDALRNLDKQVHDVGMAGTTFRFLTAFFSLQEGERILTGSERMKKRPIYPLVNILRDLGVNIEYLEEEGYPPLKIVGGDIGGGLIKIDASISSQFVSAIMMVAPYFNNGLSIILKGKVVSMPYIDMTLELMKEFGAKVFRNGKQINIFPSQYKQLNYSIESDWSAASYCYELLALDNSLKHISMRGLFEKSSQADIASVAIFKLFGVFSSFEKDVLTISKYPCDLYEYYDIDCVSHPDLAQTLAVTLSALKRKFTLRGLQTLKIKETNRIVALKNELEKFNVQVEVFSNKIDIDAANFIIADNIYVNTYNDHRMAMAFAPLQRLNNTLVIENPQVVEKSYPDFWKEFSKVV